MHKEALQLLSQNPAVWGEYPYPFFLISLEAHQTYSVNLKTIAGQDYRDLDAQ